LVVIIGGGVIGLSIGWLLTKRGKEVIILEEGESGRDASWASAGMLSPDIPEVVNSQKDSLFVKLLELQVKSKKLWPAFAEELHELTGTDVDLLFGGSLGVALNEEEEKSLEAVYKRHAKYNLKIENLSVQEALALEPNLTHEIRKAVFRPEDGQVEPRKVVKALREAFIKSGGKLYEHTPARKVEIKDSVVKAVITDKETIPVNDKLVLAAGAWSDKIEGIPPSVSPSIRPMKGQVLAVSNESNFLKHIIIGERGYYVPRKSGRLLVGATFEDVGYDTVNTAGGILELLSKASDVLPGIKKLPLLETWVGLRPRSSDDAPILGPTTVEGLVMATGHFHIGIILTPITAKLIADYVADDNIAEDMKPFMSDRPSGNA